MLDNKDPSERWKEFGEWVVEQQKIFADPAYIEGNEVMSTFNVNLRQLKKVDEWYTNHQQTGNCNLHNYSGAIGGALTTSFTPTSLGTVVKVKCACGGEVDVSDYQEW